MHAIFPEEEMAFRSLRLKEKIVAIQGNVNATIKTEKVKEMLGSGF